MSDLTDEELKIFIEQNRIMMKNLSNALIRHIIIYLLQNEPQHGYVIMKKIDEFFKPQIDKNIMKSTPSSKIYPILNKMEDDGLIKSEEDENNNMKIKKYSATSKGLKIYKLINLEIKQNFNSDLWRNFLNDFN